jgi:tetratricopeptide (TPR) repeat protein
MITHVHVTSSRLIVTNSIGRKDIIILKDLPDISQHNMPPYDGYVVLSTQPNIGITRRTHSNDVVDALYVLRQDAIDIAKYDANFTASLADYRNKAASNTALPEEANKYKVQAESAVRDKEFDDAADLYAKALRIAPWWPAGHFNRALVLSETGDYGEAMREMKHYLQLAPDAPNARAAQDKIYTWERKSGAGN